jgi:murein DD-endopeptidase MepM/ murein hydrolase activator NlpD
MDGIQHRIEGVYFFVKRRIVWVFVMVGVLVISGAAAMVFAAPNTAGDVKVSFEFQWIRQGDVGVVRVSGEDIADVRAVFQKRVFHFYLDGDDFVGLISADMTSDIAPYNLQVQVKYTDGTAELIDQPIEINEGGFGSSEIVLSPSLEKLLEKDVEDAELSRLFNIMRRFTPERYWVGGFQKPSDAPLLDWFGTWRLYNSTYWRQHTGIDVKMAVGTQVRAIASGRVMLSETMDIRGGYVLLDHGWGVYSGYAHLSQRLVVPGQWVHQGDVIGLSGLNGRSQGAHLHWEMAVGGVWTDPDHFLSLGLDAVADE